MTEKELQPIFSFPRVQITKMPFLFFFAKDTLFNHLIGAGTYRIGHLKPYKKGLLVSKRKLQS